eukprot:TRINITY_DN8528_c0_g1_i1.p1 TRINITY_DN8528_c0_g1~~TRINITY_DN8528_c0_g1_i1.p1  ORF type:complete len:414 (-),score=104.23 TRINITY_DN8528_c0_g1_i1:62-1234(-)
MLAAAAVLAALVAGVAAHYFGWVRARATLHYGGTVLPRRLVRALQERAAADAFAPVPWLVSGHAQTLAAGALRPTPHVRYHRELLRLSDGGQIALDWDDEADHGEAREKPVVLVEHGMNGGSKDNYVRHFILEARRAGMRCVVVNYRGVAGSTLLTGKIYSAGFTLEFREAVAHVRAAWPGCPLVGVGFSLGANIVSKYVCEEGHACPLSCAVAVSCPYELVRASGNLHGTLLHRTVYDPQLVTGLKRYFGRHRERILADFPQISEAEVARAHTLQEFDTACTVKIHGYPTADAYYADHSCAPLLSRARVPLLCLSAADDPMTPRDVLREVTAAADNGKYPCVVVAETSRGGHLGWLEWRGLCGARPYGSWADRFCVAFLQSVLACGQKQ